MKKQERKLELLKIAYRLFLTKGYENTSVEDIISEAQIAKGTYYYYFESKEATLEAVISMMIDGEADLAQKILQMPISIPEKLVGVITALRPRSDEQEIQDALNKRANIVMHEKINERIIDVAVPLLECVVDEGIQSGVFACDHVRERLKMLLIMSNKLFDDGYYNEGDVEVFIDTAEKMLGAEAGTLRFIKQLIGGRNENDY